MVNTTRGPLYPGKETKNPTLLEAGWDNPLFPAAICDVCDYNIEAVILTVQDSRENRENDQGCNDDGKLLLKF
jgi:hypothetical protein